MMKLPKIVGALAMIALAGTASAAPPPDLPELGQAILDTFVAAAAAQDGDSQGNGQGNGNGNNGQGNGNGGNNGNGRGNSGEDAPGRQRSEQEILTEAVRSGRAVPLSELLDEVLPDHPGEFIDARLRTVSGFLVYEIRVLDTEGRVGRYFYHARNGRPLESR